MRGIRHAKELTRDFLESRLPTLLVELREELGYLPREEAGPHEGLPDPVDYLAHEPENLDRWPLVAITGARESIATLSEDSPDAQMFAVTYDLRVFVWVNAVGVAASVAQRDDLTLAVRRALLDRPHLDYLTERYEGELELGAARVDVDSISIEHSEVTTARGDRVVAAAMIAFTLVLDEVITRTARGIVESTHVTGSVLPHPE